MSISLDESRQLLQKAGEIEKKLASSASAGLFYELGEKATNLINNRELEAAWSFVKPLTNYSMQKDALQLFELILEWIRGTQSYVRKKWGSRSIQSQKFRRGNEKMLKVFEGSKVSPTKILVPFSLQHSEFRELVEDVPPPLWKKIISYLPDLLRLSILILRG